MGLPAIQLSGKGQTEGWLGGCPRIGIFSQNETFWKNKHRHIVNIEVSLRSLIFEHYFSKATMSWEKRAFSDILLSEQGISSKYALLAPPLPRAAGYCPHSGVRH
jgi:hypothetical protein